jgi:hypothetical protein
MERLVCALFNVLATLRCDYALGDLSHQVQGPFPAQLRRALVAAQLGGYLSVRASFDAG